MDAEKIINDLYENALDKRPTFSDAMLQHMRQEVDKIKGEARKWHEIHKKTKIINVLI
jgi:hypothetical protein